MAVGLSLSPPGTGDTTGVCFDDDGYYWFLYPLFERLAEQTGQMVDPYGDAVFEPVHFPKLITILEEAVRLTEQQPEEWDVQIGWRGDDKVFCRVSKGTLQGMLADFIALVERASATGKNVVGYGD